MCLYVYKSIGIIEYLNAIYIGVCVCVCVYP